MVIHRPDISIQSHQRDDNHYQRQVHISKSGNIRVDTVTVTREPLRGVKNLLRDVYKGEILVKASHFGRLLPNKKVHIEEFIYSEFDTHSGQMITFLSSFKSGNNFGETLSADEDINFIDLHFQLWPTYSIAPTFMIHTLDEILRDSDTFSSVIYHNSNNSIVPHIFENEFQLPYLNIMGELHIPSTLSSVDMPFSLTGIMDNKLGMNITRINYPKKGNIGVSTKNRLKTFLGVINKSYNRFKRECGKENRDIRVHFTMHPFGTVFDLFDKEHPELTLHDNINASDHCKILKSADAHNDDYRDSELFSDMSKSRYYTPISSLFISDDDRETFKVGLMNQYHNVSFP